MCCSRTQSFSEMFVAQPFKQCLFLRLVKSFPIFFSYNSGSIPTGEDHSLAVPWRSSSRSVLPHWAHWGLFISDWWCWTDDSRNVAHWLCPGVCVNKAGGPPRPGMLPTPPMGGPPMMPMMGPPPHGMMPGGPGEATQCFSYLCSTPWDVTEWDPLTRWLYSCVCVFVRPYRLQWSHHNIDYIANPVFPY